ncbi:hypothetical protein [Pseudomonas rossensis]
MESALHLVRLPKSAAGSSEWSLLTTGLQGHGTKGEPGNLAAAIHQRQHV